jgi:hypothetical protein
MSHTFLQLPQTPSQASLSRRQVLGCIATLSLLGLLGRAAHAQSNGASSSDFAGIPGTRVRFASVTQARDLLMAEDEWMAATSSFYRRAVMGSATPATLEAFKAWNGDAARSWSADQVARWQRALQSIAPAMTALRLPLPPEVWLVVTNGQESAGAPYTRGNFIALPGVGAPQGVADAHLLMHELWHVVSRHDPALATRLYAELGFEPMSPLRLPEAWADIAIINPDAPINRHAMRLTLNGGVAGPWITPVLVASRTQLQPGETFFSVLDVRLLEVLPGSNGAPSTAVLRDAKPVWHKVAGPHDYLLRLGGNTGYVMHPEEALADNISLLVNQQHARNPALLERLRAVLLKPGT